MKGGVPMNRRITKNTSIKSGLMPGSLVHVGVPVKDGIRITLVKYNEDEYTEEPVSVIEDALAEPYDGVRWIKVEGINDPEAVESLCDLFNVNPIVQEDILNTNSRPKLDEYEEYIYILVKNLTFEKETSVLHGEQVSIVLGRDFVMSFCESDMHTFEPVFKRIKVSQEPHEEKGLRLPCLCAG